MILAFARLRTHDRPVCRCENQDDVVGISELFEWCVFDGINQLVEGLVYLRPIWKLFYVAKPTYNIGIFRIVTLDYLAKRKYRGAKIIGDGNLTSTEIVILRA